MNVANQRVLRVIFWVRLIKIVHEFFPQKAQRTQKWVCANLRNLRDIFWVRLIKIVHEFFPQKAQRTKK